MHALEIENDELDLVALDDASRHGLGGQEPELSLELEHGRSRCCLPDHGALGVRALTLRAPGSEGVGGTHGSGAALSGPDEVECEIVRQVAAHADAADAVASLVDPGREDGDPEPAGENAEHAARDAVAGLTPPLASVAATKARSRQSAETEHCLK
jgi:hypothetical protein